ncbi:hypothetical protein LPH45_10180 [Xylella taiwanensis]|uniref:Uncharacterized protein n=1 Tax=Xylella taiwanensis TaxID=1444770 RepID=A0ABS8TUD5_9GAMM|nr:hypothetical protein [Xylella taiwanensis]MCD8458727.1 hypothetical protein [Xylella taiwanensis]MCD8470591.1 hypothetical protein [Xylella taiwanensis]MCD8473662.1 hypothetical protein [Xylella taiwanensis]UFN06524.1 hypothetical protein LPH42_10170 [Xylella taiwanensis]UFN08819.1 hypothetical protein LPH45_10180 [Xylella taiwanensis]
MTADVGCYDQPRQHGDMPLLSSENNDEYEVVFGSGIQFRHQGIAVDKCSHYPKTGWLSWPRGLPTLLSGLASQNDGMTISKPSLV